MGKRTLTVNAKTIASDLLACKKAFDAVEVPWVVTDGIVLGYARYNKIMDWDTDLDVAVFVELSKDLQKKLNNAFHNNKFRVGSVIKDFKCGSRKTPFNLWFFHKKGNFYEAFPKSTPGFKFVEKAIWYDKPQMVDFLGSKIPMPNNINDYLDNHYGKDWKTNIIKDHETWFLNKRGAKDIANSSKWLSSRSGKGGDLWPKIIRSNDTMEEN